MVCETVCDGVWWCVWKSFDLYLICWKRRPDAKANSGFNVLSNDTLISNGSFAVQPVKCKRGHGGRTFFTTLLTNLVPSTVHCFRSLPNITKATICTPTAFWTQVYASVNSWKHRRKKKGKASSSQKKYFGGRIYLHKHTPPSHSQTSRLLTSSLSLGVPVPRATQCIRGV